MLRGGEKSAATPSLVDGLNPEQSVAVYRLANSLPAFKNLLQACDNPGTLSLYIRITIAGI